MSNALVLPPAVRDAIERVGGPRRAAILGAGAGMVLLILGLARWATAPAWVPVYSGLPLESVGAITERLDEEGISYRLGQAGTELLVSTNDLARARVHLAGANLPNAGRPGLELFDQPSWGMTDFTQRINYRRALEGELERTIGKMRGVEAAKVHIGLEETTGFRRSSRPIEASVVLSLRSGTPTPEVVQGIAHLVASSVSGVDANRVTVLDNGGRLLSSAFEDGAAGGVAARELKLRSEIERYLEGKAEQIVTQMVGVGNARVQVSAEINFDRVERTTETVDPDRQALANEQRSEIIPGAEGGAASSNVHASYLNSRTIESFSGATGTVKRLTAAVLVGERSVAGENGVQFVGRSDAELAQIRELVQSAVGFDATRGDVVAVASVPFDAGSLAAPADAADVWEMVGMAYRPVLMLLGLLFAFILGLRLTQAVRPAPAPVAAPALAAPEPVNPELGSGSGAEALPDIQVVKGVRPEPLVFELPPARPESPLRKAILERIDERPEDALRLVRTWLKEA